MTESDSGRSFLMTALAVAGLLLLWMLRDVLMLIGFAALLAYALDPVVTLVERVRLPRIGALSRSFAAALVMLALVILAGWAVGYATPLLAHQLGRFLEALPGTVERLSGAANAYATRHGLAAGDGTATVDPAAALQQILGSAASGAGKLFGGLGQLLGFVLAPVLAFYLLAEREAVQSSALGFLPDHSRALARRLFGAVDLALRSYVRGQSLVCLIMGGAVGLALRLWGFPAALLLAVVVGVAEAVPFLGFWTAAIAIAITGYSVSPALALEGVASYAVINQLIGLMVTPRVMGRHMKLHPFVITVSILAGGTLLGPGGAVLAIPAAAAIQSLIAELARSREHRAR